MEEKKDDHLASIDSSMKTIKDILFWCALGAIVLAIWFYLAAH